MSATICTCIGVLEPRDDRLVWVVTVLDAECPQVAHRAVAS